MNRAEKIVEIVKKFGESIEVVEITKEMSELVSFIPVVGRLDIVSDGDCWKVTFISHGVKPFQVEGFACSVLFRKDNGDLVGNRSVSTLKHTNSIKITCKYRDEGIVALFFNRMAAIVDLTYDNLFPKPE